MAWKGSNCLGVWETIECRGVWTIDFPNWYWDDDDNEVYLANGGKSVTHKHVWGAYDPEQGWWNKHFASEDGVRYKCMGGGGAPAVEQSIVSGSPRGSLFLNKETNRELEREH